MILQPFTVVVLSKARIVFARSNSAIMGSSRTREMYERLRFLLFVLTYLGSDLTTSWSPVQGVLPAVYKIHNSRLILNGKQARGPNGS
jgi:hypothetical protein